ncbi:porin family protein [Galbibacter sp. EGI 63066]|uniref:type IX secretion/gliding motility protein PorT/SprT n=1 Tax=Galbibacter sp. EGI 63066 TaxID=2993559 RepID=UPI0022497E6F|nr:porin family protein [Galbibacter sp. EGI 63066]MCX2680362.1 porin family protein [Galbibacter sp. EGI 63066]
MKKYLFLILVMFCLCQNTFSQFNEDPVLNLENEDKKLLNWGYYLGFNQYDFKFDYINDMGNEVDDILVAKSLGFNVGLIGELRINDYFDIRFEPGLYYNQRDLGIRGQDILEVKSTYIHLPLLIKASTKRLGNFKPYVVGGVSTSFNLSSNEDNLEGVSSGNFRMKTNNYYYEVGFGIDFYMYYFKFSPSIRGVFALSDELVPDPDITNVNNMYSRAIFINFTFE